MLNGADGFTSPPKKVVLLIFIALKKPSPSAGFEPANLVSNGERDKHYTTESDILYITQQLCLVASTAGFHNFFRTQPTSDCPRVRERGAGYAVPSDHSAVQ
jgi:hypothetical protein